MRHHRFAGIPCAIFLSACGGPEAPDVCTGSIDTASDSEGLTSALAGATAGDCVVLATGTYTGSFALNDGAQLVAGVGEAPTIEGNSGAPAVKATGFGGVVQGIAIARADGVGLWIEGSSMTVRDVTISNAEDAAMAVRCVGTTCTGPGNETTLENVSLTQSKLGLWVSGARVVVNGGEASNNGGTSLTDGHGVVAHNGAELIMRRTVVDSNGFVGVLVDGGNSTEATLSDVQVLANEGRGIWAQGLSGTANEPGLRVDGDATVIENNKLVGVGAVDSLGIIIVNGRILGTREAPAVTNLGAPTMVGDGVGLFSNTGAVTVDGTELADNQRAQMLVDQGGLGIIIVNGRVNPGMGSYGLVVQNTTNIVDSGMTLVDGSAPPLDVSAPRVSVPSVAP